MNRIEQGIKDAHTLIDELTADSVGAVPTLRRLDGDDVLEINSEGLYYIYNAANVPTTTKSGYVRVEFSHEDYKIVYWRPHDSLIQYLNVKSYGSWLGWTEIFTNNGGTLKGDIFLKKNIQPAIVFDTNRVMGQIYKNANETQDFGMTIRDCGSTDISNNNAILSLSHKKILDGNLARCLTLSSTVGGAGSYYTIFGEHNSEEMKLAKIAEGTYKGTGTYGSTAPNSLTFDFTPKMVFIQHLGSGREFGIFCYGASAGLGSYDVGSSNSTQPLLTTWVNKTLTWYNSSDYGKAELQLNRSGTTYKYVVIG